MKRCPRELLDMLTYKRPSGSRAERDFVNRFLMPLGVKPDKIGNLILRLGNAPVLWSCHTDTVHRLPGRQNVRIDGARIRLANPSGMKDIRSNCLGADDTAGVWLMAEMIRANVSGLYVFHWGEEIGGIGSTHIANETPELVEGVTMAIALDRKGKDSVITYQGTRCCSDQFANALGDEIGLGMSADDTGLFTDTANYTELIAECTNLSVGYEGAHSAFESLEIPFLLALRDALLTVELTDLPIVRDPAAVVHKWQWDDELWGGKDSLYSSGAKLSWGGDSDYCRILKLVREEPETVADVLVHHGITPEEIDRWGLH